jgi:hypothetical protein
MEIKMVDLDFIGLSPATSATTLTAAARAAGTAVMTGLS